MPPRQRNKENDGLPQRWRRIRNAYYYQVRPAERPYFDGKWTFKLGATLAAAHAEYAKRLASMPQDGSSDDRVEYVHELLDKYQRDVLPLKALRTQKDSLGYIVNLKTFFAGPPPARVVEVETRHAYKYFAWRVERGKGKGKRAARLEIALLSHAFTHAFRWDVRGYKIHPFIEKLRFEGGETSKPRDHYIEDREMAAALALQPRRPRDCTKMIQAYIRIKELTGLRRADMLRLRPAFDFTPEGIHVQPRKTARTTGHRKLIEWSAELSAAVEDAIRARPVDLSPWLFCNARGACYVTEDGMARGFDGVWQNFMRRLVNETSVRRFEEKDIRGKTGSDSESDEAARTLLGHADPAVTRKHYRRRGSKVKPLR